MTDEQKKTDDGGQAFPIPREFHPTHGMTLRDYFAGQALASGQVVTFDVHSSTCAYFNDDSVEVAYRIADAMLKARGER